MITRRVIKRRVTPAALASEYKKLATTVDIACNFFELVLKHKLTAKEEKLLREFVIAWQK